MTHKPDGGTAFPFFDDRVMNSPEYGMTLRDYFAAAALQGIVSAVPHLAQVAPGDVAEEAYMFADAMLQERAK